jgi:hypothetical protein
MTASDPQRRLVQFKAFMGVEAAVQPNPAPPERR